MPFLLEIGHHINKGSKSNPYSPDTQPTWQIKANLTSVGTK